MTRTLGAFLLLGLASMLPVQQAAAQDVLGGAIVEGTLGGRRCDWARRRHCGCGYRCHDGRRDRRRGSAPVQILLLAAERLLLSLPERPRLQVQPGYCAY